MEREIERLTAENEKLKKQLEIAVQEKVGIIHELRAPLASIQGYAELLLIHKQENLNELQVTGLTHIMKASKGLRDSIVKLTSVGIENADAE